MGILGENLRKWRKARGLSGWFIEKHTGIPRGNVYGIEKSERPASRDVMERLAALPELELPFKKLRAWQILDETSAEEREWVEEELADMRAKAKPKRRRRRVTPKKKIGRPKKSK